MTRLINKETMNLKATLPKRLFFFYGDDDKGKRVLFVSNSSSSDVAIEDGSNDNQDCDPQKNEAAQQHQQAIQVLVQWEQRPTTPDLLEREKKCRQRGRREKSRDRKKQTYSHCRLHCHLQLHILTLLVRVRMREKRWSVYIQTSFCLCIASNDSIAQTIIREEKRELFNSILYL